MIDLARQAGDALGMPRERLSEIKTLLQEVAMVRGRAGDSRVKAATERWSAAEVGEQPEKQGEDQAEQEAGDQGEIESGVLAAVNDVPRQATQAEREFAAEIEKRSDEDQERAEKEERLTEIAEGLHDKHSKPNSVLFGMTILGRESESSDIGSSDEFQTGKKIADFEGGGFGGVGAVSAIVADAGAEVAANGAGGGFPGVGSAHGLAPSGDGGIGFENHGDNFARTHEVGEFAEEGALLVDGVKAAGFLFREPQTLDGYNFKTACVDASKNFTL
jgi:hypothetical protein